MLTFEPLVPRTPAALHSPSLRIHVRDHKLRELPPAERSLEAHYSSFVFTQSRHERAEARRLALSVAYGGQPTDAASAGREARVYELGPPVPPDDIDGRVPAVVVWHDEGMFFLMASGSMTTEALREIANSVYTGSRGTRGSKGSKGLKGSKGSTRARRSRGSK